MDFFEQQRRSRLQSHAILLAFVLALGAIAVAIHLMASMIGWFNGQADSLWSVSTHTIVLVAGLWLTIALGALFRWLDVRGGGSALARRFRAEQVLESSRDAADQRLLDVVSEMAVASSQQMPGVWVLRHEPSINAFVAGSHGDIALIVSQGALEQLEREELCGVVAHEFGHLAQGDLPINMRLLVVLGGLLAIEEVGSLLTGKNPQQLAHPGVLVGYTLRALGSVATLAGGLIRAAFSRKREYLADASAVQFTRDTLGVASALDRIRNSDGTNRLNSGYAGELAHMCFHTPESTTFINRWFPDLLATHPHIDDRIEAIEPYFQVKRRKNRELQLTDRQHSRSDGLAMHPKILAAEDDVVLSDRFSLFVSSDSAALAALFALFARDETAFPETMTASIAFAFNQEFAERVRSLHAHTRGELATGPLKVLEHISELLQAVSVENLRRAVHQLETILRAEGQYTFWNYLLLNLTRKKLAIDFALLDTVVDNNGSHQACGQAVKPLSQLTEELSIVVSLMIEATGVAHARAEGDFTRIMRCYTNSVPARPDPAAADVQLQMEKAFDVLAAQSYSTRCALIDHMIEIMHQDGELRNRERLFVRVMALALDIQHEDDAQLSDAA